MSTKGSWQRPTYIGQTEADLRWELAFKCVDNPERRKQIVKLLKQLEKDK